MTDDEVLDEARADGFRAHRAGERRPVGDRLGPR
jgi:hypothetical protein